jgi:hypothetical protein
LARGLRQPLARLAAGRRLGRAFVGICILALTEVGERFRGAAFAGVFAVTSVPWGSARWSARFSGGLAAGLARHGLPR